MSKELESNTDFNPKAHAQEMVDHYQEQLDACDKVYHKTSAKIKSIETMLNYYKKQL